MSDDRLNVNVRIDEEFNIIVVEFDAGKKKINVGLSAEEAQHFSVLLHEASIALMLDNMRKYEQQQSELKH